MTRTPQRFFKLCTFYLPIVAIAICVTPWLGVPFMTRPLSMMTVEHFSCGRSRCNTCTHTNVSAFVDSPGRHITISDKFTCTRNNVVYVIKYQACSKLYIGETCRRLGDRFREHLRSTRTANTDLPVARHFYITWPLHCDTEDMLVSAIR